MTAAASATARLITMPHSHYSEKARWALDRVAMPYCEEPHVPLLHRIATRRNGGGSVPLLVDGSSCEIDSTGILAHADAFAGGDVLYPREAGLHAEVAALEDRFDEQLGPHTRRWAYAQLLPERALLLAVMSRGVPRVEAMLLRPLLPMVRGMIRDRLRITPESAARSLDKVQSMFREIDAMLADGRLFLVDGRFTAADLAFAALAAPVLFPPGYRGAYPALEDVPAAMREEVLRLRDTRAGHFACKLFAEERGRVAPAGSPLR